MLPGGQHLASQCCYSMFSKQQIQTSLILMLLLVLKLLNVNILWLNVSGLNFSVYFSNKYQETYTLKNGGDLHTLGTCV